MKIVQTHPYMVSEQSSDGPNNDCTHSKHDCATRSVTQGFSRRYVIPVCMDGNMQRGRANHVACSQRLSQAPMQRIEHCVSQRIIIKVHAPTSSRWTGGDTYRRSQEQYKRGIVSPANTVVHPLAVVVTSVHAIITLSIYAAMSITTRSWP